MFNIFMLQYDVVFSFSPEKKNHRLFKYSIDFIEMFRLYFRRFMFSVVCCCYCITLDFKEVILTQCLQSKLSFAAGC